MRALIFMGLINYFLLLNSGGNEMQMRRSVLLFKVGFSI